MADHPDYAARAIHAGEQAELAFSPGMADGWRRVAESYRKLAWQTDRLRDGRKPEQPGNDEQPP